MRDKVPFAKPLVKTLPEPRLQLSDLLCSWMARRLRIPEYPLEARFAPLGIRSLVYLPNSQSVCSLSDHHVCFAPTNNGLSQQHIYRIVKFVMKQRAYPSRRWIRVWAFDLGHFFPMQSEEPGTTGAGVPIPATSQRQAL